MRPRRRLAILALAGLPLVVFATPAQASSARTVQVDVASDGTQADLGVCPSPSDPFEPSPVCREPDHAAMSADGRFVAFQSSATNLVARDTNGCTDPTTATFCADVFVHDLRTGTTTRANVSSTGAQSEPDPDYVTASIAANGRYVAFTASASNLVPGDTNQGPDVFVRDLVAGTTSVMSVGRDGQPADTSGGGGRPDISADGRFVAFATGSPLVAADTNGLFDIYLRDRSRGTTTRVSVSPDGQQFLDDSFRPHLSPDGRFVVFTMGFNLTAFVFDG